MKQLVIAFTFLASAAGAAAPAGIDTKKTIVVMPFTSEVKGAPGFPEAARDAVVAFLKDEGLFAAVIKAEEAKDKDKSGLLELGARLTEFKGGSMATRALVGLGAGRASAELDFELKDGQSGSVVWQKRVKEKASFWSNSASSSSQRAELPEKLAQALLKELKGGKK